MKNLGNNIITNHSRHINKFTYYHPKQNIFKHILIINNYYINDMDDVSTSQEKTCSNEKTS